MYDHVLPVWTIIPHVIDNNFDPLVKHFLNEINSIVIDLYACVRLINFVPSIGKVATGYTNEPNAPFESKWVGGPME